MEVVLDDRELGGWWDDVGERRLPDSPLPMSSNFEDFGGRFEFEWNARFFNLKFKTLLLLINKSKGVFVFESAASVPVGLAFFDDIRFFMS